MFAVIALISGGGGSSQREPVTIKANPKASAEGLKLKEVQETMNKADTFLKENSGKLSLIFDEFGSLFAQLMI